LKSDGIGNTPELYMKTNGVNSIEYILVTEPYFFYAHHDYSSERIFRRISRYSSLNMFGFYVNKISVCHEMANFEQYLRHTKFFTALDLKQIISF